MNLRRIARGVSRHAIAVGLMAGLSSSLFAAGAGRPARVTSVRRAARRSTRC